MNMVFKRVLAVLLVTVLIFASAFIPGTFIDQTVTIASKAIGGHIYSINNKSVSIDTIEDPGTGNNELYIQSMYKYVWGEEYTTDCSSSDNIIKNYIVEERALTGSNLKKFVLMSEPGSVIRVENSIDTDINRTGFSFFIVAFDEKGLTVFERTDSRKESYYTWDQFCEIYSFSTIEFIKYPNAAVDEKEDNIFVEISKPSRVLYYDKNEPLSGNDIKWVQGKLVDIGYDTPIDGYFGAKLENIVKAFQKSFSLAATGSVDRVTADMLEHPIKAPEKIEIVLKDDNDAHLSKGDILTVKWSEVAFADYYRIMLVNSRGKVVETLDKLTSAEASFVVDATGTYTVRGCAYNEKYSGEISTMDKKVRVHNTISVIFADEDGTVLNKQTVPYGTDAVTPVYPKKNGYSFAGWDKEYTNVTEPTTVTAQYVKKIFSVTFYDAEGNKIGNSQKVKYGEAATAPDSSEIQGFICWDKSFDYIEESINVSAVVSKSTVESETLHLNKYEDWTDWTNSKVEGFSAENTKTKTQYRYKTKTTTSGGSSSMNGWTKYDAKITSWTGWSAWQNSYVASSSTREVKTNTVPAVTKQVYVYYRWVAPDAKSAATYNMGSGYTYEEIRLDSQLAYIGTTTNGQVKRYGEYTFGKGGSYLRKVWYYSGIQTDTVSKAYTQYSYRDAIYTYYFYKWSDWTAWQDAAVSANDNTQVETRKMYSYNVADYSADIDGEFPVTVTNAKAVREGEGSGYTVTFDVNNRTAKEFEGRAVVALKTTAGKFITLSESSAFILHSSDISTNKFTKKSIKVLVPYSGAATVVEIYIIKNYKVLIPVSAVTVINEIEANDNFTDWLTDEQAPKTYYSATDYRTEYRKKERETKETSATSLAGWERIGERIGSYTYWGWSDWTSNPVSGTSTRDVEKKTESYVTGYGIREWNTQASSSPYYRHYWDYNHGAERSTYGQFYREGWVSLSDWQNNYRSVAPGGSSSGGSWGYNKSGVYGRYDGTGIIWFPSYTSYGYNTYYRYQDKSPNYLYTYARWKDWSDWSTTPEAEVVNKVQVETRQTRRYEVNDPTENDTGKTRTLSGAVDKALAGKQATLFIYKINEASDYTNEYIGQTIIEEDGSYRFTFKLREEPGTETGDFTVTLGIEDTNTVFVLDSIKAPLKEHTVNICDYDGTVLDTQIVKDGESAVLPTTNPARDGYTFVGWNYSNSSIFEDTNITALYVQDEYTVVFIDWTNQTFRMDTGYHYGDPVIAPDLNYLDGALVDYGEDNATTRGRWKGIDDGTVVTQNMVITAEYDEKSFDVVFYDYDKNVISVQKVKYGEAAEIPEFNSDDEHIFIGWDNEQLGHITKNIEVEPKFAFSKTAEKPVSNTTSGIYHDGQTVSLASATKDAVIYYSIDDGKAERYTQPIRVEKSSKITAYAAAFGHNNSEKLEILISVNKTGDESNWKYPVYVHNGAETVDSFFVGNGKTVGNYYDVTNISDWISAENVPEGAQIVDQKYAYTEHLTTESEKHVLDGWTLYDTKRTSWSDWSDWLSWNPENDIRNVEYRSVYDHTEYHYYRWRDKDCKNVQPNRMLLVAEILEERWFDHELSPVIKPYGYWYDGTNDIANRWIRADYQGNNSVDPTWSRDIYRDEWRYQDPVYTYYYYKDENKESNELPQGDNISNVQQLVRYRLSDNEMTGHILDGYYTDSTFAHSWNVENDKVTSQLDLYLKYTPKSFVVCFVDADGNELKTETVEYLGTATPPEIENTETTVFAGWDSKEFNCVTDNMTVRAVMVNRGELASVSLNKASILMISGMDYPLEATVAPSQFADNTLIWSSSDPTVATVDANGVVTAVAAGQAEISATVAGTVNAAVATCLVKVSPNKSENICLIKGSGLTIDQGMLLGILPDENTVEEILKKIDSDEVKICSIEGKELSGDAVAETGASLLLVDAIGKIHDSLNIVVAGDINCDGYVNNRDAATLFKCLSDSDFSNEILNKKFTKAAADVNADAYIGVMDVSILQQYTLGLQSPLSK